MKRRTFIKYAFASISTLFTPLLSKALPQKKSYDLVGIKGGSPSQMFQAGINSLGGMGKFVKKGQTVLVKPNIGWNRTPGEGANTQPDLVGEIVKQCTQAGAKEVSVFDHTCNTEKFCYHNSGIKDAVLKNGGKMYSGDNESDYRKIDLKGNKYLKNAQIHKLFLDSDVIINVPVLKNHAGTRMTAGIKNLMGVVWDRRFWHKTDLHNCIAEFSKMRKIDLTVIDAYTVMVKNGPRGVSADDIILKRMQVISTDMVLADTASAKILNMKAVDIPYLTMSEKKGTGSTNLKNKKIKRISLS